MTKIKLDNLNRSRHANIESQSENSCIRHKTHITEQRSKRITSKKEKRQTINSSFQTSNPVPQLQVVILLQNMQNPSKNGNFTMLIKIKLYQIEMTINFHSS